MSVAENVALKVCALYASFHTCRIFKHVIILYSLCTGVKPPALYAYDRMSSGAGAASQAAITTVLCAGRHRNISIRLLVFAISLLIVHAQVVPATVKSSRCKEVSVIRVFCMNHAA